MENRRALPWLMLCSRSALFLAAQALIAAILKLGGESPAWNSAGRYWILYPILANLGSISLLLLLFQREGKNYLDLLRINRQTIKTDLLWFFGSGLIGLPVAAAPMNLLGKLIYGDPQIPIDLLFQPIPNWVLGLGLLFPLTIPFAELPTYFGYAMPRLFGHKSEWLSFLIAASFLALQHIFLPFIPDGNYLLWRALMYLPFALYVGLMVKLRPTLLPFFLIVHMLMDFSVLAVYLML